MLENSWNPDNWLNTLIGYCWWAGYINVYYSNPNPPFMAVDLRSDSHSVVATDFTADNTSCFIGSHLGSNNSSSGGNTLFLDASVVWLPMGATQKRFDMLLNVYY